MTKVLECGTLIDGVSDTPIRDAVVVVEGDRIVEVGPRDGVSIPDDAERIDHSDEVAVPGLIDLHVHLNGSRTFITGERMDVTQGQRAARATMDAREILAGGVTTVRDQGSIVGIGLREAVAEGEVTGPRIFSPGRQIAQVGGHGDYPKMPYEGFRKDGGWRSTITSGAENCRTEARKRVRAGADHVKVMATSGVVSESNPGDHFWSDGELAAFAEEAHRVGLPWACHCMSREGIKRVVEHGADTVEHGVFIDREGAELIAENDALLVATLGINERLTEAGPGELPPSAIEKIRELEEVAYDSIRNAYRWGAPIALGTDSTGHPINGFGEHVREAELLVEIAGMSEMEVIRAATSVAARGLKKEDELGRIEPGYYADILTLNSDPLDDIGALGDVDTVYKAGEEVEV